MATKTHNFLRRPEGWVIKLKNKDYFLWTRIKLTTVYALILTVFFVVSHLVFRYGIFYRDGLFYLFVAPMVINILGIIFFAVVSYYFVKHALAPIKENIEAQKSFISSASHELRTPLSIIRANSELALIDKKSISKNEALYVLKDNIEEIDRMSEILTILIRITKLDINTEKENLFFKIDAADVVRQAIKESMKLADNKNVTFNIAVIDNAPIWGNEFALKTAIKNILHNAVSYTPNGGNVDIFLGYKESNLKQYIELCVKDTGIGIPKNDLKNVFNPFYRAAPARVLAGKGHFGLGLSLVHKIIKEHRGYVGISSAVKKGTTVTIKFPLFLIKKVEN